MTGSPVKVEITYNDQCGVTVTPANAWSATEPTKLNQNGGVVTYCN